MVKNKKEYIYRSVLALNCTLRSTKLCLSGQHGPQN